MKKDYEQLFKKLVKSYYDGNFDEVINEILNASESDKKEAMSVISSLCGVEVKQDENYVYNLKRAITEYKIRERIVEKLASCNTSCRKEPGEKTNCQRVCAFDAILEDPLTGGTYIDESLCVDCGMCVEACDSGKLLDRIEFMPILELLKNNEKVIAAVAPAISGQWGPDVSLDQLRAAFMKAGFTDMIEVAFAADMLTIKEAVEFDKHVNKAGDLMITSCCCPMWVGMLKRVYHDLVKDVSPSVSPMIAAGRVLKTLNPDAKVVFIGPCIAKKAERNDPDIKGSVDYVLTFQEVRDIFDVLEINPGELTGIPSVEYASRGGRLYARTGGVSIAVSEAIEELFPEKHKLLKTAQAHGVKDCKEILAKAQAGELGDVNFIEGMGCIGGCVGGPKAIVSRDEGKTAVDDFAYDSPVKIATHSPVLDEVFKKIGIEKLEDFRDEHKIEIFERTFS
ncbi:[Fe-Fe] hydrogenase large subunit C-terminal domain-containing protein [Clostridium sp. 'White wine YQ']|uniref:[Fe-Fe] hydrogenase large subunit C-terminal domain-containing protein n=1 Tax=Clostridium sp. 'White wine YQ' TaxID=3027474 RepID=UPI0023652713|nr:[Fe-Fe] hydrogenase large subunit C-terminal domain-containing protein [Clostridium sp. 'White wine YQ']MDD7795729.1 [Fe-Fe] hydrogenase large subunit C-terminal domain-containing protein [Clostridium sp. 'White wine YQ']